MSFNLGEISQSNILVIGDIMLDRYIWGGVNRISPEAPVPVVKINKQSEVLGGAGNVAANLSGLGCSVNLIGVCGNDEAGSKLKKILNDNGIKNHLIIDSNRPTTTKTRIMAQKQQLFRLDEEEFLLLSNEIKLQILERIDKTIKKKNAVIISDYGKGIMDTPDICQNIINKCNKLNIPVIIDPKGISWGKYIGATCITPNIKEMEAVTGINFKKIEKDSINTLIKTKKKRKINSLLLTRGADGMCLLNKNNKPKLIPTIARKVYDVSGAGDTVIATLSAGIASGLTFEKASELANVAAGVVVGKVGTHPITRFELDLELKIIENKDNQSGTKVSSLDSAIKLLQVWKKNDEKIVFTNGCFDLLHPGHINLLKQARTLGNRLIVGLNSNSSIKKLKGDNRPILVEKDRAAILSALECIDLIITFNEETPSELIKSLKPDILVKGKDYKINEVLGKEIVESYGGKVRLIPLLKGHSSSDIADKIILSNKNNI